MPIVFGSECTDLHAGLFTQEVVDGLQVSYVLDGDRMVAHISPRRSINGTSRLRIFTKDRSRI